MTATGDSSQHARTGRLRRVLFAIDLNPTRKFGSLEEQILLLTLEARRQGGVCVPLFITDAPAGQALAFPEAGFEVHCLDLLRWRLRTFWALWRLVRRHRIEIIHWHLMPPLRNPYVWAMTLVAPGVDHYFTDHVSRSLTPTPPPTGPARWFKRLFLARYGRVIGVSRYVQKQLAEQGVWRAPQCQIHFVNTDRFRPNEVVRAEVRRQRRVEDRFVVLLVANLIREKGVAIALQALTQLPSRVVLWVAGEGEHRSELEQLARSLGLVDRVTFLGNQVHTQPFLQAADCAVCPSLWAEAAGLVNLEAQACGLPVVASRVGGIPEYVLDGQTGLLFEPGDAGAMADCLCRLVEEPGLCRRLGESALRHAREQFSVEARLPEYIAHYRHSC